MRSAAARFGAVRVEKVRFSGSDSEALRNSKRSLMRASLTSPVRSAASGVNNTTEAMRNSGLRRRSAFSLRKLCSWASVGAGVGPAMACVTWNQRPSRVSRALAASRAP